MSETPAPAGSLDGVDSCDSVVCPSCGAVMTRERRMLIEGRVPFRCPNGHLAVDDNEVQQDPGCGYLELTHRNGNG